jgi:hypothetical protein
MQSVRDRKARWLSPKMTKSQDVLARAAHVFLVDLALNSTLLASGA